MSSRFPQSEIRRKRRYRDRKVKSPAPPAGNMLRVILLGDEMVESRINGLNRVVDPERRLHDGQQHLEFEPVAMRGTKLVPRRSAGGAERNRNAARALEVDGSGAAEIGVVSASGQRIGVDLELLSRSAKFMPRSVKGASVTGPSTGCDIRNCSQAGVTARKVTLVRARNGDRTRRGLAGPAVRGCLRVLQVMFCTLETIRRANTVRTSKPRRSLSPP